MNIEQLADMFTSCTKGGIILAIALGDNQALIGQIRNYGTHLRLVFGYAWSGFKFVKK